MTQELHGTDYLTGNSVPMSDLNVITMHTDTPVNSSMFPETSVDFAIFTATFCRKYGESNREWGPVMLTKSSLRTVAQYFHESNGAIRTGPNNDILNYHEIDPEDANV